MTITPLPRVLPRLGRNISGATNNARYFLQTRGIRATTVDGMPAPPPPATWEAYARALGVLLQRHRVDAGLTQEQLAHRAGMTRTHYQQLERGWWKKDAPSNPSAKVLVRLAQVLDVEPGDLLPPAGKVRWPGE